MKKTKLITIIVFLVGLILSIFVLYTPAPNTVDESSFNTKLAIEYIAEISQEEHSVFDPENHENVRLYLKDKLEEFVGTENVYEYHYDRSEFEDEIEYDIDNLLAIIPGKSDTGIMIVAHYDSRGHIGRDGELGNSFGAADDGYGLATMLEIARLYGGKDLENSIYILMTDGEETGLYGAGKAAQEPFMDNVGFVINIEARGVRGPAYMFETSTNNDKVLDFYKETNLPFSYSIATAVYTVMPNSTDFTKFLAVDKNGVNFAVLNGLEYYHTPHDNLTNINASSIQHYGEQIIPLVDEFAMNSEYNDVDYFDGESNQIFFNLFPNVFISYNEVFGSILHIVLLVITIAFTVLYYIKKRTDIKKIGVAAGLFTSSIVASIIVGYIISNVIAFLSKVPFNLTYVRSSFGDIPALFTLVGLAIVSGWFYKTKTTDDGIRDSIIIVGAITNLLFAVLVGFTLSGASFLFLIPGLSSLILIILRMYCRIPLVKRIVMGVIMVINLLILVPLLFSLYVALTVGGLLALAMILMFYLVSMIPVFFEQYN